MVIKFVIVAVCMFITNFMNSTFWIYTSIKNLANLKKEYFRTIMKQEQGWFDQNNPYQFSTMVQSQIKTIEAGLGDKLGNVLMSVSMFISGLVVAFTTSWKLTLVLIAILPLMAFGVMLMTRAIQNGAKKAEKAYTKAGGVSEEVLYQIKTVASFANFDYEINKYDKYIDRSKRIAIQNGLSAAFGISFIFFVLYGTYCLAIWFGSTLIINKVVNGNNGKIFTGGDVLTVILSAVMAGVSLGGTAPNMKAINEARVAASDLFELRERKPVIDLSKSTKKPNKEQITGKIELKNVDFAYPKNPEVKILNNISLVFQPGKKTAIVGESGSGKSTIVNLLERLYDTTAGEIFIDGINIRELDLPTLRSYIGYVQQEPVLFNKTIKENLIFGREGITDKMIENACKESLASEFIDNINERYEFIVGIKGKNLSGGQKQRLAIARAILTNPKILILDEATSALDNRNEKEVQISLDRVSKNVTTVVIAHRLTTIINADTIIAMRKGEIIEMGSHQELLDKGGYYATLFKSQLVDEKEREQENDEEIDGEEETANNKSSKIQNEERVTLNNNENENKNNLIDNENTNINKPNTNDRLQSAKHSEPHSIKSKRKLTSEKNHHTNKEGEIIEDPKVKEEALNKRFEEQKKKLFKFLANDKCTIFFASLSAAFSGAVFPVYGIVLAISIDALSNPDAEIVKKDGFFMSMMFLVIAIGAGLAIFFQNYLFAKIGEILCRNLRSEVFKKYLKMHIGFFDRPENAPGSLITRLSSDTTKLNGIVLSMIGVSVQSLVNLILGVVLGFIYDWRLSLISLAFFPFIALSGALQHKLRKGLIESDEKLDIESGGVLSESVINTKTIFSFNMEGKIVDFYDEIIMKGKGSLLKQSLITGCTFGFSQFITFITYAVIFYAGGSFIMQGTLTFGNMMKAMFSILFAAFGLGQAQQYVGDYSKAKIAIDSIFAILDSPSTIDPLAEEDKLKTDAYNIKGKIEFRNVSFYYPTRPETKVLKNISFIIEPGQNVAFTGFSGSGKSTIIQLIERFYDCQSGEILIDDINIKEYNIMSLRKKIGIVMQEPNIFKRSVALNILYGKFGSSFDEVKEAAIKANIGDFFADGKMGEKDDNVSGGQKQRISIARAILKNPRILLLDEATSALDKNSEADVQKAIDNASLNRTTVTVAHRLSTIEKCDVIFVLNHGVIVEKGTHEQLLALKGLYHKQYNCSS